MISGSVILLIGNLAGSLEPSDSFNENLIHERYAKGTIAENNPFSVMRGQLIRSYK